MRLPALLMILGFTAACAPNHKAAKYSGYYMYGFEVSAFRPKDSDEHWWLVGDVPMPCTPPDNSYVYLEVIGELSSKGKHGHMGWYDRQLLVREFVSCRPARHDELREL